MSLIGVAMRFFRWNAFPRSAMDGGPSVNADSSAEPVRTRHPANVPGPFYVEAGCCIACGVWEMEAPGLLAWLADAEIPHCYVARQPETDKEFEQMMAAMSAAEVDCIRVQNCRPDWEHRLREADLGWQIDPGEAPHSMT